MLFLQEEYFKNRPLSTIGSSISDGVASSKIKIPVDQALFLQTYGKLGKTGYNTLRLSILPYGLVFPTYDMTSHHKHQKIVPTVLVITNLIIDSLANFSNLIFSS